MIVLLFCVLIPSQQLELVSPLNKETIQLNISLAQTGKLKYLQGENYTFYVGGRVVARKYGSQFYVDKWSCGFGVINTPFKPNVDYNVTFFVKNLLHQHVFCMGIASEGFLVQEILKFNGYDPQCVSKFQKGFCTDDTRSNLYKDMYTNYDEFTDTEYIDKDLFNIGEHKDENLFHSDSVVMSLKGNTLTFVDQEHDKLLATFEYVDRSRVYLPMFIMRKANNTDHLRRFKPKVKRQSPPKQLPDCVPPSGKNSEESEEEAIPEENILALEQMADVQSVESQNDTPNLQDSNQTANPQFFSFAQIPDWVSILIKPFTKVEEKKVSPKVVEKVEEDEQLYEEDVDWADQFLTLLQIDSIEAYPEPTGNETNKFIKLRESLTTYEDNPFTIVQNNLLLPQPLQEYESCSYAYLAVPPLDLSSNVMITLSFVQFDFTNGVYPIGIGVYATEMLDVFRGWRNALSQIWCLENHLFQYGAFYRTDGTFYDSQIMGEYNKYSDQKPTNRQGTVTMYFSKGNRLVYRLGRDKRLYVTCVNSRFKYFQPIVEFKAWKGRPMVKLEEYENHHVMPFEFSDSERRLYENFGKNTKWVLLNKFYVEKRGAFNESDDDFMLSCLEGEICSMNLWDTQLYRDRYEWFLKVEQVDLKPSQPVQICVGVHQFGQEFKIEQIMLNQHTAQVAYICDKNDYEHTFYEECPIYENKITIIPGSVLRFRLGDFLMEVNDGYDSAFFSLRRAGNTAVVPSVIVRGNNNRISFIRGYQKPGQNPIEYRLKNSLDLVNFQNFVAYDVFQQTDPNKDKKLRLLWRDQQPDNQEKYQTPKEKKQEGSVEQLQQAEQTLEKQQKTQYEKVEDENIAVELLDQNKYLLSKNGQYPKKKD